MILLKEYEDLSDVLIHIKKQVIDSLDYASDVLPSFRDPSELFYYLKDRTVYLSDPTTIELLMTMQTLMEGTRTGIPGAGDCDDFTITGLACCIVNGWLKNKIVLVGRDRKAPVHIYFTTNYQGVDYVFDLTNPEFNHERNSYKFRQYLEFRI